MQIYYIFITQRKVVVWWVLSYSNEQPEKRVAEIQNVRIILTYV